MIPDTPTPSWIQRLLVLGFIVASSFTTLEAANILLVPVNINSYVLAYTRMGIDLSKLGHVVTVLAPGNAQTPDFVKLEVENTNFTYLSFPVDGETPMYSTPRVSDIYVKIALSTSLMEWYGLMREYVKEIMPSFESDCARLLSNTELMEDIRSRGYDYAIIEPGPVNCLPVLPYSLGIAFGYFTPPSHTWHYRVPRLFSFSSWFHPTDRKTFAERLTTLVTDFFVVSFNNESTYYLDRYASHRPPITTIRLFQKGSAWFFWEDLVAGFPVPQMPNTIAVGDVMLGRPCRPLAAELREFVAESKGGVVIVSFGSYLDYIPDRILSRFCEAFRRTPGGLSFIWKLRNNESCRARNVLAQSWLPQYDLLADPKVRLLISHGGLNSLMESIYHAKPLIVLPLAMDQPGNAAVVESKGYGIRMNIANFTAYELVENIDKILADNSYRENVERASQIIRDRRDTPAERVSHMIEHILKYGDKHLRTGAFELSDWQFFMFDIFAFILAVFCALVTVAVAVCWCVLKKCRRVCRGTKSKTE